MFVFLYYTLPFLNGRCPAWSVTFGAWIVRDIWGMDAQFFFLYCALHTPYMNRDVLRQSFMRERVGAALRASPMGKEVS